MNITETCSCGASSARTESVEIAALKDQNEQLRSALRRIADYVGGSVSDSASHVFHVMVADEVSAKVAALRAVADQILLLKKENEAMKKIERQRRENVKKTLGTQYPKQMNEGESAKWTSENQSAAQWARKDEE